MTEQIARTSRGQSNRTAVIVSLLTIVLVGSAGFGIYSFHAWRNAVADNPLTQQQQVTQYVNTIAITPNENPQIATVKDASKLTSGALARITKNGDILLIYSQANRIIVYRPSVHKIVDMLSIQTNSTTPSSALTTRK
ncbi:MAG TPA: hypothetical protein VMB52_03320 [Verrucomicrobiae bacterium]|nr:hypothetical protein [Verrucomicrobiae bacterium]